MQASLKTFAAVLAFVLGMAMLAPVATAQTHSGGTIMVRDGDRHGGYSGSRRHYRGDGRHYRGDRHYRGSRDYRHGRRYDRDRRYYGSRRHHDRRYHGRPHRYRDGGIVIRLR